MPYMLIFAGKTDRVVPQGVQNEPSGIKYSFTPSHFANTRTTLEFMQKILVPHIKEQRRARIASGSSTEARESSRWAVLVWDNFSAHLDPEVSQYLTDNHIKSLPLPSKCTSKYQPLDVLINGAEKRQLTRHFAEWYFQALHAAANEMPPRYDVLPVSSASKRKFIATLIAGVHHTMAGRTIFNREAWTKSTLLDSLQQPMDVDLPTVEIEDNYIQRALIQEMLAITLGEDVEVDDTNAEISDVTQSEDPVDIVEHMNQFTLLNHVEESELEFGEEEPIEEEESDDDSSSNWNAGSSIRAGPDDASCISCPSTSSELSCGLVHLERPSTGGSLRAVFKKGPVLSPQQLEALLSTRHSAWKHLKIASTFNLTSDGFDMKLLHVKHGSVAMMAPSLSYTPTDLTLQPQNVC